jgi:hypothetical protein
MKYTILDAHIKFFQENGLIEFEDIFPFKTLEKIQKALEKKSLISLDTRRDLFRKSEIIKEIAYNKTISLILKTLTKKQNLRLAFDQLIIKNEKSSFNLEFSLNSLSSFQNLIGGIIVDLSQKSLSLNNLSKKNISIFIKSSTSINIENILLDSDIFLLIAYGELKTVYKCNTNDPNNNYLKQFGYNFGDVLKDSSHPIVF